MMPTSSRHIGLAIAVTAIISAAQIVLLMNERSTLISPPQDGRPYLIRDIHNRTRITQRMMVSADGLDTIRIEGAVAGPRGSGAIEATIVDLSEEGGAARHAVAQLIEADCCTFTFAAMTKSSKRPLRLELTVRDMAAGATLALPVVLEPDAGEVNINGHVMRADLQLSTGMKGITPLDQVLAADGATRMAIPVLLVALSVTIGLAVVGLVQTFRRSTA